MRRAPHRARTRLLGALRTPALRPVRASFGSISLCLAPLLAVTAGCSSHLATNSTASVKPLGITAGLSHPESVRYDSVSDVYYVSNINGDPSAHDGNGFIDVVSADSFKVILELVHGGPNTALSAPKGMAISGDTLWVADIDTVRAFDKHSGDVLATVDLAPFHAAFLNDVTIGGDGAVYVTDTGTGDSTDATGNVIYRITGGKATVALATPELAQPNGITWDATGQRFLLAPGGRSVQTWTPPQKTPVPLITGPGTYDGIELLADGRILVTSWADSALHAISDGVMSTMISGLNGPADIGVDTRRQVVAVPRLMDDRVEYFRIR